MLNFKELTSFQQQTANLSERRHKKSKDSCRNGFLCLIEAEKQEFRNKDLLEQACDFFAEAISQDRLSAESYLGMGYLLFLLQDYPSAINYLQESSKLAPDNPDVALLLGHIQNQAKGTRAVQSPPPSIHAVFTMNDVDSDLLYDEVEALIYNEVRKMVSGMLRPAIPSINEQEILGLQQSKDQYQTLLQEIITQLNIIDEEIDTSELRHKLKPLETMVKRIEQALMVSQEMVAVQEGITGISERLPGLHHQLKQTQTPEELLEFEHLQEIIMDMCDQIADQLDAMEQKKYPVQPLIYLYERFIGAVETLNERYEDMSEQFSTK